MIPQTKCNEFNAVTRQELADLVGTTLFTVSRLLAAWEHQGLIHSTRGHVTVTKPSALKVLAESPEAGPEKKT